MFTKFNKKNGYVDVKNMAHIVSAYPDGNDVK